MAEDRDLLQRLVAQVSRQGRFHGLLVRQLRKSGAGDGDAAPAPAAWARLLASVDASYRENDDDRATLERSLHLVSEEMQQLYEKVERQNAVLHKVVTRYVSEDVAKEVLADPENRLRPGGDMVLVSYLVSRVAWKSDARSRDPRSLLTTLNAVFAHLVPIIFDEHATFDKYLGDMVMAFYGAPVARTDDAIRAVRTALRLRSSLQDLSDADPSMADVSIASAVVTGYGVVGNLGTERLMDYTCIGETPATAVLLGEHAESWDVLVCPATYEATHATVRAEPVPPVQLRGRLAPLPAFRVKSIA